MKASQLKKLFKEACREAFQEELKDLLLEAIKSPKASLYENYQPIQNQPIMTKENGGDSDNKSKEEFRENLRKEYGNLVNEIDNHNSKNILQGNPREYNPARHEPGFTANPSYELPEGEVSLDQISKITNSK